MSDDLARAMRELGAACKRVAPAVRRLQILTAAWEAERAAAHFEGRVPPSAEVFYEGYRAEPEGGDPGDDHG